MSFVLMLGMMTLFTFCNCNKYSAKINSPDYKKLKELDKPFRIQKLNLVWEKAAKKLSPEKLKALHTDLKFQDKEELSWKIKKSEGRDKSGLKESMIQTSFKAILEKYKLQEDFEALLEASMLAKPTHAEMSEDDYLKNVFRDKKLNKLWLKAGKQGFSGDELKTLKEEFQHHQDKIDQYYQIINQLHKDPEEDNHVNTVEHLLHAEVGEKLWKSENPHQVLKEKHSELKLGYDYLNKKIIPDIKRTEFDEPQVNALWEIAKNTSFTMQELESLKNELHHFEHRVKKLKTLAQLELEMDDANIIDEVSNKRNKKLKDYNHKVEKLQKEITSRIFEKHSEL